MGLFTLKNSRRSLLPRPNKGVSHKPPGRGHVLIPSEAHFAGSLLRERRRTDRSGKPFLLMLLDISKGLETDASGTLLARIWGALCSSIRETDTPGWQKNSSVLGILFTELTCDGSVPVIEVISRKILSALATQLTPKELKHISLQTHLYPDHWGTDAERLPKLDFYPDLADGRTEQKLPQALKRAIDILGSSVALVILSPVFVLLALLIRLTSRGPVLFRQYRTGRYGRQFSFLKFRTMYCQADENVHKSYVQQFIGGHADRGKTSGSEKRVYKMQDDPRVTPIGNVLRKTSLDELPQFWNVLRGEMSLVGPRPPIPYEVQYYDTWHLRRLLEVKPGITGLWQIHGRSRTKFNDMVRLDLQYAKSWSIWLDLKILFRTPRAVISGEGAY